MKTTILGGLLFLAPIAIVAIIMGKVFQFSLLIAEPVDGVIPIKSVAGVATVNVLAILLIIVVCFCAGLLARRAFFGQRMQRLDGLLIDMIPGYAVFKGMVGSVSSDQELSTLLVPVFVRFDDYEQIAFEIEKNETHSVLFLPGAPSAWSGSTVIAEKRRVQYLELPTHQTVQLLRAFGRGTLAARQAIGKENL